MTITSTTATAKEKYEGQAILRREDDRLLRAEGEFADDTPTYRLAYVQFVRSPYAHARITKIDVSGAALVEGFVGTLTPQDVEELSDPFIEYQAGPGAAEVDRPLASGGKVRYVGEPVVAVAADSREAARDAAAAVVVEYEPLPVVVDARDAVRPEAPVLHEGIGSNVSWQGDFDFGDIDFALENADHVIEVDELHFHRFSPTPLETFVVSVDYDAGMDTFTIQSGCAQPQLTLLMISKALRHPVEKIRLLSKDIGGSFGVKVGMFIPMVALALMARKFRRPVRWTQTRSEAHMEGGHSNERTFTNLKIAVQNDGTVLGVTYDALDDHGAYTRYEPLGAPIWSQVANACYQIKHLRVNWKSVYTNKGPTLPVRGYSRMQHLWAMERLFDIAATKLGLDPVEFRLKNYIQPEQYPYTTVNECVYDSGNLPLSLRKVLELIDYEDARRLQAAAVGTGKRIGIGIGSTLDSGTNNFGQSRYINPNSGMSGNTEAGLVRMGSDGSVYVVTGGVAYGQGHETTMAQVVADMLGLRPEDLITHRGGDSLLGAQTGFSGSYASQFVVTGIGALIDATNKLVREIKLVAGSQLGATPDELVLEDGMVKVAGDPDRQMPIQAVGWLVHMSPAELPRELAETVTLVGRGVYNAPFTVPDIETKKGNLTLTYSTQVHAAVVEIDEETGQVTVLRYGMVDDCGNPINPMLIQGQVHGATAHGLSAALFENFHYTPDGQLLGANFYDYHAATSYDMPTLRYDNVVSPSPFTPTGAKGMGEGGGAPQHTLGAAVQDALRDTGMVLDSHIPSEVVLDLLAGANSAKVKVIR
ncbi:xanthine dehydrogenase family protein molybdopterin-binding subunit [Georgenia thermotolerans]|uniref:Molybdopterin-dependent oxidoreductase n=1 Tax=Georgenia thermotolerans TaxID=527326 RepID=A0A7J5UUX4_9MICO|nr:xanthine dehydrogenase family protein molybdopterin-binding subunit [Georgenia thermotolerans]KAE8766095.1 molybdopterin-dependent oxidoreductase [Georgenia thermotolerans]